VEFTGKTVTGKTATGYFFGWLHKKRWAHRLDGHRQDGGRHFAWLHTHRQDGDIFCRSPARRWKWYRYHFHRQTVAVFLQFSKLVFLLFYFYMKMLSKKYEFHIFYTENSPLKIMNIWAKDEETFYKKGPLNKEINKRILNILENML
jgi:hypothetical protein